MVYTFNCKVGYLHRFEFMSVNLMQFEKLNYVLNVMNQLSWAVERDVILNYPFNLACIPKELIVRYLFKTVLCKQLDKFIGFG